MKILRKRYEYNHPTSRIAYVAHKGLYEQHSEIRDVSGSWIRVFENIPALVPAHQVPKKIKLNPEKGLVDIYGNFTPYYCWGNEKFACPNIETKNLKFIDVGRKYERRCSDIICVTYRITEPNWFVRLYNEFGVEEEVGTEEIDDFGDLLHT